MLLVWPEEEQKLTLFIETFLQPDRRPLTSSKIEFHMLTGRFPKAGDLLRRTDLRRTFDTSNWRAVWERHLQIPFPHIADELQSRWQRIVDEARATTTCDTIEFQSDLSVQPWPDPKVKGQ
jgi:hypothetical protein